MKVDTMKVDTITLKNLDIGDCFSIGLARFIILDKFGSAIVCQGLSVKVYEIADNEMVQTLDVVDFIKAESCLV